MTDQAPPSLIIGYPKGKALQDYEGKTIEGVTLRVVSSWPTPNSWVASRRFAYRASYKGREYHGRGYGDGMSLVLRISRRKAQAATGATSKGD